MIYVDSVSNKNIFFSKHGNGSSSVIFFKKKVIVFDQGQQCQFQFGAKIFKRPLTFDETPRIWGDNFEMLFIEGRFMLLKMSFTRKLLI